MGDPVTAIAIPLAQLRDCVSYSLLSPFEIVGGVSPEGIKTRFPRATNGRENAKFETRLVAGNLLELPLL